MAELKGRAKKFVSCFGGQKEKSELFCWWGKTEKERSIDGQLWQKSTEGEEEEGKRSKSGWGLG